MEYKVCKAFTALRTALLTDDLVGQVVEDIIPDRNKIADTGNLLSKIIGQ